MILLDTHVWIRWLINDADPLPIHLINKIESADEIGVSTMSCWEVTYLYKRDRIEIPLPLSQWLKESLQGSGIQIVHLTFDVAIKAAMLPDIHRDPVDRFIIAEAIVHNRQLISLDRTFAKYEELNSLLIY